MAISGPTVKSVAALGATAALAALCGWTLGSADTERSLGRSVASALSERTITARPAASTPSEQFDSEALRLSSWPGHEPLPAGLVLEIAAVRLDATPAGLLARRRAVEGELLGELIHDGAFRKSGSAGAADDLQEASK